MPVRDYCLCVWGDYACFTRPEMKVERVSYDVLTPSAARSIFESILWKPAIRWRITRLEVLNPIKWISLRRNEVGSIISSYNIDTAAHSGKGKLALYIEDERQMRAGLFLRDVAYRVYATLEVLPSADKSNSLAKFMGIFERRAQMGQCVNQPYLGTREFSCQFRLIEDKQPSPPPIDETRELGLMLYDMDFANPAQPMPCFFRARLEKGVVHVPTWESVRVMK